MFDYSMAASNMYGVYPNIYNNQIAMNDLSGLDLYTATPMMDPMMSMQGSIFSGGYPIGGMQFMPAFSGGGSYEDYYKNYDKYQDFMINSQVRQQQRMRNADLQLNSPQEGIQKQAEYLHEKIMRNEQQQIQESYLRFKESVRNLYGDNASEEQIANRASTLYSQMTGKSIAQDIREHGRDSFTQGFLQTLTLGFADKKTAEENISELTGQPVGRNEKTAKFAGNIAGGALVGGGIFCLTNIALKGLKLASKSRTFWGIIAGAAAGLGAALATSKS